MQDKLFQFSECLYALMQEKKISATALASALGLSSKTSVFRVLQNTASVEYQAEFMERILSSNVLELTEEETELLKVSMEVSRLGEERYLSYRAIEALVNVRSMVSQPVKVVEYCGDGAPREWPLQALMETIVTQSDQVDVIMTGWGHVALMSEVRKGLLKQSPGQVNVQHYLCCKGRRFIEAMASIMPVIYLRGYEPYCLKDDDVPLEIRSLITNSSVLISMRKDGVESYAHLRVIDGNSCEMIRFQDKNMLHFYTSVIEKAKPYFRPVKTVFELQGGTGDYLRYIEFYLHMESNHPAYILRYDVPLMFIPTSIQTRAATDGFMSSGFYTKDDVEEMVSRFIGIEKLRWNAAFTKRRPTHVIFSWKGMLKFVRTGKTSDQFFGMRPYTPDERLAIMLELKRQMMENPYFNLYFTPADSDLIMDEISYYDGYGLFFCKGETDYNLDAEHAEALITEPDFCNIYKSYFMTNVLKKVVVSNSKVLQMMDELISIARSMML